MEHTPPKSWSLVVVLCDFSHASGVVNLSHNDITEVDRYALHQVSIFSTLDLSFNCLETLHNMALVRLERLDLSHNQLRNIDTDALQGLHQTFHHLNLAFNNLSEFHADGLFHQTNSLHTLDLSHNYLGRFLRESALRRLYRSTSLPTPAVESVQRTSMIELSAEWAWPDDMDNPFSYLPVLTSLDLSANELTHLGCDVLASLRALSYLVLSHNLITNLTDVSLHCATVRLAKLDVSNNQLSQIHVQSLSSLSDLVELDARSNPLQCAGDMACVARLQFRRWLNDTVQRLTLTRQPDDTVDEYLCQDSRVSYISGTVECSQDWLTSSSTETQLKQRSLSHSRYTRLKLVSISAVTVLIVAVLILVLGLVVGRRYWHRSDLDYCKRRQAHLLPHDTLQHQQPLHHVKLHPTYTGLVTSLVTWLRDCCSTPSSMSTVGYSQVIAAELDVTSSAADVTVMTSSGH